MKKKYNILIIDHLKPTAERLMNMLKEIDTVGDVYLGYDTRTTIWHLADKEVDVVLLDDALPDEKSPDLLKWIRSRSLDLKAIIAMGNEVVDDRYREMFINSGADHFIDKFNEFEELERIINSLK